MLAICKRFYIKAYTKQLSTFQALPKTYRFTIQLGKSTTTLDPEGDFCHECDIPQDLSMQIISNCTTHFLGEISQLPPAFSAKKINGQRAYKLARQGKDVALEPNTVTIHSLSCLHYDKNKQQLDMLTTCSKGTYVRSLSRDIAKSLGTSGYTISLVREAIGDYTLTNAQSLKSIIE